MAQRLRAEGFVFKKSDSGETSRIFSVFTKEYGRVEVYGKAIRKMNAKLRAGIGLFSFCEIEFVQGRHQRTLVDSRIVKKTDIGSAETAKAETVLAMSRHLDERLRGVQKDEFLYSVISDVLDQHDFPTEKQSLLYEYFLWNFFVSQGKKPELESCVLCREPLLASDLYFSFKDGGTLCVNCGKKESAQRVSSEAIKVLRIMLRRDLATLARLKTSLPLRSALELFSRDALTHWES